MRTALLVAFACLASSCHPRATASGSGAPGTAADGTVKVEYREPKNPAHRALYDDFRQRHVLEQFAEALSVLRLPRTLTLRFQDCDGDPNAWYDPEDTSITFCYEYAAEFRTLASTRDLGRVTLQEASDGPIAHVMFHETGHAVFNLLEVPILGKEEDAADTFASIILLRLGPTIATRTLKGTAWNYAQEAATRTVTERSFADVHSLDKQRYYNVLCIAYGSAPERFASLVTEGYLPKRRSERCVEEYEQAAYAMKKLIAPSIDAKKFEALRAKHSDRWEPPKDTQSK